MFQSMITRYEGHIINMKNEYQYIKKYILIFLTIYCFLLYDILFVHYSSLTSDVISNIILFLLSLSALYIYIPKVPLNFKSKLINNNISFTIEDIFEKTKYMIVKFDKREFKLYKTDNIYDITDSFKNKINIKKTKFKDFDIYFIDKNDVKQNLMRKYMKEYTFKNINKIVENKPSIDDDL